jgi:CRISP-associated protein Cas1
MTDESHWSVRNIAEYAYCPRLFYLMEVEGVYLPSADTEEGMAVHGRVDRPSARKKTSEAPEEDPERPRAVRSLSLTSNSLGITATLDIAEICGANAVPVEYRKGRPMHAVFAPPPDTPDDSEKLPLVTPEPWPADMVQVGLQAILLEEEGLAVKEAVLYYAGEKLRLRVPVDAELKSRALATLDAAKKCALGERPLPLVNDARCPRCSLQPLCLPDEVNYQRTDKPPEELTPRRMWPPRDDGIHVVAQQQGIKIGVRGMSLKVTNANGETIKETPITNIESLSLLGSVQITTQAIHTLAERGIPIAFMSAAGRTIAMIDPLDSVSAKVRRAQIRAFDDPVVCLELSKSLVTAKIMNQRRLLQRNHPSPPGIAFAELKRQAALASRADSIDSLRGHEGLAAAIYFEHFSGMFSGPLAEEFKSHGRQRRPPPDPINSCLSFAYTMLTHECTAALRIASLEPSIGAYHVSRPGRPALALDLMEPFRPLVSDSIALSAFNRDELREGHFMRTAAGCVFTDAGRRAFFNAYDRRMNDEVTHPLFGYRLSYRRMLALHARMTAAWLLGEIPALGFLTTR